MFHVDFAHISVTAAHDFDGFRRFLDFLSKSPALECKEVAAALDERQAVLAEDWQACDGARNGEVILLAVLLHARPLLCSRMDAVYIFEAKFIDDRLQEIDALVQRIHERQVHLRAEDFERQAGEACASTDINYRYLTIKQRRIVCGERVDHVLDGDFMFLRNGSEIHFLIPLHEQLVVARELRELVFTERQPEVLRCSLHLISKHPSSPSQSSSFCFAVSWRRFCCSSQTSSTDTSAGETPLMRPA